MIFQYYGGASSGLRAWSRVGGSLFLAAADLLSKILLNFSTSNVVAIWATARKKKPKPSKRKASAEHENISQTGYSHVGADF